MDCECVYVVNHVGFRELLLLNQQIFSFILKSLSKQFLLRCVIKFYREAEETTKHLVHALMPAFTL